jgi:hypothetical protein
VDLNFVKKAKGACKNDINTEPRKRIILTPQHAAAAASAAVVVVVVVVDAVDSFIVFNSREFLIFESVRKCGERQCEVQDSEMIYRDCTLGYMYKAPL